MVIQQLYPLVTIFRTIDLTEDFEQKLLWSIFEPGRLQTHNLQSQFEVTQSHKIIFYMDIEQLYSRFDLKTFQIERKVCSRSHSKMKSFFTGTLDFDSICKLEVSRNEREL